MASTLKIVLAVTGIFLAGAVTGGFVSVRVAGHMAAKQRGQQRFGPTEIGARLAEQLRLTPEQKERIRPILSRTSEELRKVRREAFNETAALITRMDEDLSKELTEEQRVRLKQIRAEEDERRKRWSAERAKRNEQQRPPGVPPPPDMPPPTAPAP